MDVSTSRLSEVAGILSAVLTEQFDGDDTPAYEVVNSAYCDVIAAIKLLRNHNNITELEKARVALRLAADEVYAVHRILGPLPDTWYSQFNELEDMSVRLQDIADTLVLK